VRVPHRARALGRRARQRRLVALALVRQGRGDGRGAPGLLGGPVLGQGLGHCDVPLAPFVREQLLPQLARARQLVTLSEFAKVALLTPTTLRAASLSVACPLVCSAAGVVGNDFDPALLSLIIAVPSSISINAAYTRRERALTCLARFRSATYALHHSIQRWGRPADRSRIQRENAALYESLCVGLESGGDDIMFRDVFRHLEEIGEVCESVRLSPRRAEDARDFMPALSTLMLSDERMLWQTIDELRMLSSTATPYLLRGFTVGGATALLLLLHHH